MKLRARSRRLARHVRGWLRRSTPAASRTSLAATGPQTAPGGSRWPSDAARLRRIVAVAQRDSDLTAALLPEHASMLDAAQMSTLYWLTRLEYLGDGAIAELGAYTGGTTCVFGEALTRLGVRKRVLEVYDLFEHNDTSRKRLAADPAYDKDSFYEIWRRNTAAYAKVIDLRRGDLRVTATERHRPLELLYVDVVKHESLIDPVMRQFLPRLEVGGLLVHQDYFHWQSPWVVYATEHLMQHFEIVGTVSNHMMVLQLASAIESSELSIDWLTDLDHDTKLALMAAAIDRYPGIRAGLLRVSRLHLAAGWAEFDAPREAAAIRVEHAGAARVIRYLDAVEQVRSHGADASMW